MMIVFFLFFAWIIHSNIPHTNIHISPSQFLTLSSIPSHFQFYFAQKNTHSLFSATNALIAYTDKNNGFIEDFSRIDGTSTAHIFILNNCMDMSSQTSITYLKSTQCHSNFCEFDAFQEHSLESISHRLFGMIHHTIYHINMDELEKFESGAEYLDSLEEFPGWKPFHWNQLYHPQYGTIPAIFASRQDC